MRSERALLALGCKRSGLLSSLVHTGLPCAALCAQIGDAGIKAVAEAIGPRLKHVEVNQCTRISDVGLRELAIRCPNLETLHLDGESLPPPSPMLL